MPDLAPASRLSETQRLSALAPTQSSDRKARLSQLLLELNQVLVFTADRMAENSHVGDFGEYVSKTGRDLGGRDIPVPGTLVEQARTGAAEPIWLFPAILSASG